MAKYLRISLLAVVMLLMSSMQVMAAENVVDNASLLTDEQAASLEKTIDDMRESIKLDTVIVTVDSTDGKSAMAYADDFYDYGGYGYGTRADGLLLLVDMGGRVVWISTTGEAIDKYGDAVIERMVDHVTSELSAGNYYAACLAFLKDVKSKATFTGRFMDMFLNPVVILLALALGFGATLIATFMNRSKVTVTSQTYETPDSFMMLSNEDSFSHEHVTRVRIQKSSGGGGSTHRGSSGRSHGGGGGRF